MNSFEQALAYLLKVGSVTAVQLFTLGGPVLVLILVMSKLSELVQRIAITLFGVSFYLLLFGWFGTAVHETGHLIFARAFGHKVLAFRPFAPDLKRGRLGNVDIQDDGNLLQYISLFFLGIAPILFGTLLIFLALYFLFHDQMPEIVRSVAAESEDTASLLRNILMASFAFIGFLFSPEHLLDWRLYLFLYIAFAIGSSIHLSSTDISVSKMGCLTFTVILFMFNLILLPLGITSTDTFAWISPYYTFFYVILVFVMLLNLLAAALLWLPASIRRSA